MKKYIQLLGLLVATQTTGAQVTGGVDAFEFLNLPASPIVTSLGGLTTASPIADISLAGENPALLRPALHNQLGINHNWYYADIKNLNLHYGYHIPKLQTTFGVGIQYLNYGQFESFDEYGQATGAVSAQDFALRLKAARQYNDRWHYGVSVVYAASNMAGNKANALMADVGLAYVDTQNRLVIGMVAKHMGGMLKAYDNNALGKEPLPFDWRIGVSKGFEHVPLRFYLTYHHLHNWDIAYNDPMDKTRSTFLTDSSNLQISNSDKFFRHIIFGAELTLAKRLAIRAAYNHQRRKELLLVDKAGGAGFSFGASLYLDKFLVHYGYSQYHISGGYHELGLTLQLNKLLKVGSPKFKSIWTATYPNWE